MALSDEEIEPDCRLFYALPIVYEDKIDTDKIQEYKDGAIWFLNGGQDNQNEASDQEPTLDYNQDQMAIYSTFFSYYGINLTQARLHWFEFRALMYSLPQDTLAGALMYYRGKEITADMPEWERKQVQKIKSSCKIVKKSEDIMSDHDFIKSANERWHELKGRKDD